MLQGNLKTNFLFAVQSHVDSQSSIIVIGFLKEPNIKRLLFVFRVQQFKYYMKSFLARDQLKLQRVTSKAFENHKSFRRTKTYDYGCFCRRITNFKKMSTVSCKLIFPF